MKLEPEFLSVDEVIFLHDLQLERYGGAPGIRDPALLESAVFAARATFDGAYLHGDLFAMAAAYAFHLAQDQPFVDGNKRTGLAAALVFLDLHGVTILDPEERLYTALIDLAGRMLDKQGLASLLGELAVEGS